MKGYEKLAKIRMEKGYSLSRIAKVLNATTTQVRRWESGEVKMKFHKYVLLAKEYNLSLDYIVGLIDTPNKLN
ncbi:MAG: helix-turn-helix transcriptional regulator [Clostridia bacterium]|nr:helix-turn-helix transcriptional regulator [Clostridia bacterium]